MSQAASAQPTLPPIHPQSGRRHSSLHSPHDTHNASASCKHLLHNQSLSVRVPKEALGADMAPAIVILSCIKLQGLSEDFTRCCSAKW